MFMKIRLLLIPTFISVLLLSTISSSAALERLSQSPYAGAIAVDAASGAVLFEDSADVEAYPASLTKLMVLLIILEGIEAQYLAPDEMVTVTAEAARIGGTQVYLKENEVFPVDELLYALMVESANDAAAALAIHYAGSKEAFVERMNRRAGELGMSNTAFHSVNGLPPSRGQLPDVSTPRDFAELCRELLKYPSVLKYTSTRERAFRTDAAEPFIMRNHNHLLKRMNGCDGLKTGYFPAAGYSIAATASKNGQRAVAIVFGAERSKIRDVKAQEILTKSLIRLVMGETESEPEPVPESSVVSESDVVQIKKSTLKVIGAGSLLIVGIVLLVVIRRTRKKFQFDRMKPRRCK
jgi:D-alanyl-D-alanine carboxypeptidase (penicillin-binding protein 5/6)